MRIMKKEERGKEEDAIEEFKKEGQRKERKKVPQSGGGMEIVGREK